MGAEKTQNLIYLSQKKGARALSEVLLQLLSIGMHCCILYIIIQFYFIAYMQSNTCAEECFRVVRLCVSWFLREADLQCLLPLCSLSSSTLPDLNTAAADHWRAAYLPRSKCGKSQISLNQPFKEYTTSRKTSAQTNHIHGLTTNRTWSCNKKQQHSENTQFRM